MRDILIVRLRPGANRYDIIGLVSRLPTRAIAVAVLVLASGCRSNDPFRVAAIQLGSSLNADKTVARHTTSFTPDQTIHVAVITAGIGSGTISAKWWLANRLVSERETKVSSRDETVAEFSLKSTGPFPIGDYRVEIFLDGQLVETRPFRVEKPR